MYEIYMESVLRTQPIGERFQPGDLPRIDKNSPNQVIYEDAQMLLYGGVVFSFVDENGIKVGEVNAAREDHRGFLGSNVMVGYNPWGWGGDAQIRGLNYAGLPLSVMERELTSTLPNVKVVDDGGEVLYEWAEYLPYSPGVIEFQKNALLEDEDTTFSDLLDAIIDPSNEIFPGESFDSIDDILNFNIQRGFTDEEKRKLIEIIRRKDGEVNPLLPNKMKNIGLIGDDSTGLEPYQMDMFDIVLNAFPDVDYDAIKNWLSGRNSRFDLMDEDYFMKRWTIIADKYIRSWDTESQYLEWLWDADYGANEEAVKFTEMIKKELYNNGATWPDGKPMIGYDSDRNRYRESHYYYTDTNYDKSSELGLILETDVAQKYGLKDHFKNVQSALLRLSATPIDWGVREFKNPVTGAVNRTTLSEQLRIMQPGAERFEPNQNPRDYFRYIDGKRYTGSVPLRNPQTVARILRNRGYNARIIPTAKGRRVYFAKKEKIPKCVIDASKSSGVDQDILFQSFRRGYGAAITNPSSVRNKSTGQKRPGGWPAGQRFSPTAWGCARAKKLGRLKENAKYDQDLIRKWRKGG